MGRELRRVPLDFDWELNEIWHGYKTPEDLRLPPCPDCNYDGRHPSGLTRESWAIDQTFYASQIASGWGEAEREHALRLAWCDKIGQAEVDNLLDKGRLTTLVADDTERGRHWEALPRTAAEINALNAPGARGLDGHDASNRWLLVEFRCKVLGITYRCPTCEGHQDIGTPEERYAYENYEGPEPPTGEGYQLWETTSEGSPITPVFATLDDLCEYAATNVSTFADIHTTAEEWKRMLDDGFVMTEMQADDGTRIGFI